MTGVRTSMVYGLEEIFGSGTPMNEAWIAPPVGSYFNFTHSRSVTPLSAAGTKTWEKAAYGALTGSWEWTFSMDYDYIEPLALVFEDHSYDASTKTHTFSKVNNGRIPSFTVRKKQLNRITDSGVKDETVVLRGCVVRNMRISKNAGSSEMSATLTGFYASDTMTKGDLTSTDYKPYDGNLVEYACLFAGSIADNNYVANTESLNISIENNSAANMSTCSPFAGSYFEGPTTYSFGTTCYSNDPAKYKQRLYSGGQTNTETSPKSKGMGPLSKMNIVSFNEEYRDRDAGIATAVGKSTNHMVIGLEDVVFKSLTWQKGDGTKLMDQINGTNVRLITIEVKSQNAPGKDDLWKKTNPHCITYTPSEGTGGTTEGEEGGVQEPTA